jgi:hypothetical protein
MTRRRTYGLLAIAQRHPRLLLALRRPWDHTYAIPAGAVLVNGAPVACAPALPTHRGEPYIWPQVPWRTDRVQHGADRRGPRASRFGDLS